MQASIESIGPFGRRLSFALPSEQIMSQYSARLSEIARSVRIKGFRPGKIPPKVIEQRYGQQAQRETVSAVLQETFETVLRDHALRLAGHPEIQCDNPSDFRFTATFEVMPEFSAIDVTALSITRPIASVEESDIDQMIEHLRLQRRQWQAVTRGAQLGDRVTIESWSDVEGTRFPPEGIERSVVVLGSHALFAPIEEGLRDVKVNEEKVLCVKFPKDWRVAELADKDVTLNSLVKEVAQPLLPAIDTAFIESFGIPGGEVATFRKEIRANLERELNTALMNRLRQAVADQLVAAYGQTDLPPQLVQREARLAWEQQQESIHAQNAKVSEPTKEEIEPFLEPARKRILIGMLLAEIARRNAIRLDQQRVLSALQAIASTYEDPDQVISAYSADTDKMTGLQTRVMEEQVIEWIADHAQQTTQQLSFREALGR